MSGGHEAAAAQPGTRPGHLSLARESGPWRDQGVPYDVVLDGQAVARLSAGGTWHAAVSPGRHTLHLEVDWCRSRELELNLTPGVQICLLCRPRGTPGTTLFWITLGSRRAISLSVEPCREQRDAA